MGAEFSIARKCDFLMVLWPQEAKLWKREPTNNPDDVEGLHSRVTSLAAKRVLLTLMGKKKKSYF